MHFPELALGAGGLGGLGGELSVGMNLRVRVVAKGELEPIPECCLQLQNVEIGDLATRAFVVAKLEKSQGSVGASTNVVCWKNGQVILGRGVLMIVQ